MENLCLSVHMDHTIKWHMITSIIFFEKSCGHSYTVGRKKTMYDYNLQVLFFLKNPTKHSYMIGIKKPCTIVSAHFIHKHYHVQLFSIINNC